MKIMDIEWLPKDFFRNLAALYGVNIANFIVPWISVPYLVRVIGPENYGLLAFAGAIMQYCTIVSDYGYNFIGPREFSLVRTHQERLSALASTVLWTRLFLAMGMLVLVGVLCFIIPLMRFNAIIIFLSFGSVLGGVFLQSFLLQGMERFRTLSRILLTSKVLATAAIFVIIKKPSDFLFVPLIYSIGQLLAGALIIAVAVQQLGVRYSFPNFSEIKIQLRSGWRVFLTSGVISFYTASNTVILSIFTTPEIVGWYAAGERIVRAAQGLITPVYNVVYPYVVQIKQKSTRSALMFLQKLLIPLSAITGVGSILLAVFSGFLVHLLFGYRFEGTIHVVRIISIVPLLMSCTIVSANLFLLACGFERQWSRIAISSGMISFIASLILVGGLHLQHIGAAIAVVIGEALVMVWSMLYFIKECKLLKLE